MVEVGLLAAGSLLNAFDGPSIALRDGDVPAPPGVAEQVAADFLATVDWTSPTLLIWMPGINSSPGVRNEFLDALTFVHSKYWLGTLEFPRYADIARNRPIGTRALQLVLQEIRRRDPDGSRYRVVIGADSLGAYAANEAMLGDEGAVVDAMATFGKSAVSTPLPPSRARVVRDFRHGLDFATLPYIGWAQLWTDGGDIVFGGSQAHLPGAILHALLNPFDTIVGAITWAQYLIRGGEKGTGFREHPHNYWREMPEAARWLVDGA